MNSFLNYHHLYYFWVIARAGSIAKASAKLKLSQPTLSTQLKTLEDQLQTTLFERKNRSLILTEEGKVALEYAEEIFSLGDEFLGVVQGKSTGKRPKLRIGVLDSFPKLLTYQILQPLYHLEEEVQVQCIQGKREELLTKLASHEVDLMLTDAAIDTTSSVKAYNHLLGKCSMIVFGAPRIAKKARANFPESLESTPVLLPTRNTVLRNEIDTWLGQRKVTPLTVAEFEDSALMKVFASNSEGVVFLPHVVEKHAKKEHGLHVVARVPDIVEPVYLVSLERKVKHPLVMLVLKHAKSQIFSKKES